jgi:DNA-binding GntR family transcriptional regulator
MADTAIIPRKSLSGEIVALVRDMIIDGELRPGDKVPEQALCTRFGVSRTPLREALKVLAAEGLLQLSPNRGAAVARITRDEIDELFPIMGALEALAGEIACARIDDAGIARIRALHDAMLGAYRRGEAGPYAKLNRAIHEALFEAAGNATLAALYENLMVRIHSVRFHARKSPARWREAVDDHVAIMAALEARDGPALARILRLHLRHKAELVAESLDEGDDAATD